MPSVKSWLNGRMILGEPGTQSGKRHRTCGLAPTGGTPHPLGSPSRSHKHARFSELRTESSCSLPPPAARPPKGPTHPAAQTPASFKPPAAQVSGPLTRQRVGSPSLSAGLATASLPRLQVSQTASVCWGPEEEAAHCHCPPRAPVGEPANVCARPR